MCFRASLHVIAAAASAACLGTATDAGAAVVISSDATQNMNCSGGMCAPTAASAVLNTGDLENLLAAGNVEVTTTGAGVQARDIDVKAAFGWSGSSVLTLDAYRSIAIDQPVSVAGLAGVAVDTSDGNKGNGGALTFGKHGNVTFGNLSSSLTINGSVYTFVGDIKTLASDIATNPNGDFALAAGYDAGGDGTYASSPIPTTFTGHFEGLGNAISNFSLDDEGDQTQYEGFFAELGTNGSIADFGLSNADVISQVKNFSIGTLVGWNLGTISGAYATGPIAAQKASVLGGLAGINQGTISVSSATGNVTGLHDVGGLVGYNVGAITDSFATGDVSGGTSGGLVGLGCGGSITNSFATGAVRKKGQPGVGAGGGLVGGLEGDCSSTVSGSYATGDVRGGSGASLGGLAGVVGIGWTVVNCYATGNVVGGNVPQVGGLIGLNGGTIQFSYSTGAPSGGSYIGGFIGNDEAAAGSLTDAYWDTDTSGVTNLGQGAGNIANDPGITGLTTAQFQSGLPAGFDSSIWGESANINDGLPYLLANPPQKRKS